MRNAFWLSLIPSLCLLGCSPPSFQTFQTPACAKPSTNVPEIDNALIIKYAKLSIKLIPKGDELLIILKTDDFFKLNSPSLLPSKEQNLEKLTQLLKKYGPAKIKVAAYTDNVASPAYNLKVSEQQSRSLTTFLWVHGIDAQQLYAVGYGDRMPVADNATTEGSGFDRRIEITVKSTCTI